MSNLVSAVKSLSIELSSGTKNEYIIGLNSSVGWWVGIQSAGEFASETSKLRILHSAEEDNLSRFD